MKNDLIEKYLCEAKKIFYFNYISKVGKDGNYFVVTIRNTEGMKGTQDKFSMHVINNKNEVIKDLGSHPTLNGAIKFGENRGYKKDNDSSIYKIPKKVSIE